MAKKKTVKQSSNSPEDNTPDAAVTDQPDRKVDHSPKVRKAADAVGRAKAELEKAQELYHKVRQEATAKLKNVREKTLGDLIDGTLEMVKKHPGPGLVIAAVVGFFLGRLFRR